jgi:hypothetical protein
MPDDDILQEAKEAFDIIVDFESENRRDGLEDLKFARLGEQWPSNIVKQRTQENRPCLTINKLPAFIRQVVNDARQNKPQIRVHPVDSGADKETADIYNGLIRNIEYTSDADVAYDTATECAVSIGFGYFRVGLHYAFEDTFDLDLGIERISNPFSVYGDPHSTAADSSDWNSAFVVEMVPKETFSARYKDAGVIDWSSDAYNSLKDPWVTEDQVMVAEWWRREEYEKDIFQLSDGSVQSEDAMEERGPMWAAQGIQIVNQRTTRCHRVKHYLLTGADVLEEQEWAGKFIPIIPVYGDEVDVEGKRYFKSLIRDAKDAQRMFNYWRTTSTELVALAPRAPFIGPKGAFKTDANKWATANTQSHAYIEYDVTQGGAPQRQPFDGTPAGALQEALNASDDMKAIIGLYDASLGARSNETSGKAILARQREGDVSTFHFQDNMSRAIRHAGRILIDLIPHVYNKERIVRTIGEDGTQEAVQLKTPVPVTDKQGQPVMGQDGMLMTRVFDLGAGKYDLTVTTGPSFTTRREEAAEQMTEMVRAFPAAAPVMGDLIAKNLDWPGADEIADRLKAINPALQSQQGQGGGIPPEVQQQMQKMMAQLNALEQENAALKGSKEIEAQRVQIEAANAQTARMKAQTDQFKAETERVSKAVEASRPQVMPREAA